MADREKVRLMARLAMLEKHSGRKIRKAENTSRIDLITNPVWRWGLFVTLLYFALIAALAVLNMDMVLDAVSKDRTKSLIMIVLITWLSLLAATIVISFLWSVSGAHRVNRVREQYRRYLLELERISRMEGRRREAFSEDDLWEEPSRPERNRRRSRPADEDLDYRHMEVLEFEDDDYCYYVEAVPKRRGGRHG